MGETDEALMLAYAGGDGGAFEHLYAKHKGPLFRYVLRSVKGRGEAEELFQDIWMKVIAEDFGHPANLGRAGDPQEIGPVIAFVASRVNS